MADTSINELVSAAGDGDHRAADELFATLYQELHEIAAKMLYGQSPGHTLQPTALVHEAYLKLIDPQKLNARGTAHFRALAAKAMGQILVDHARGKNRQKRGGNWRKVELDDVFDDVGPSDADLLTLYETLENMKRLDGPLARVVELRLLGGLSTQEASEVLDMSVRSVERDWALGKAWLRREFSKE